MAKFRERELENIKNTIVGNTCQKFTIPLILFTYTSHSLYLYLSFSLPIPLNPFTYTSHSLYLYHCMLLYLTHLPTL